MRALRPVVAGTAVLLACFASDGSGQDPMDGYIVRALAGVESVAPAGVMLAETLKPMVGDLDVKAALESALSDVGLPNREVPADVPLSEREPLAIFSCRFRGGFPYRTEPTIAYVVVMDCSTIQMATIEKTENTTFVTTWRYDAVLTWEEANAVEQTLTHLQWAAEDYAKYYFAANPEP